MANLSIFSDIQTYFQTIIGDTSINTTFQNDLINQGHEFIGYSFPWPFMKKLWATKILSYETQYDLPSDWREFDRLIVQGKEYSPVDREQLRDNSGVFYIDRVEDQILINPVPTTNQDSTTASNTETAGSDVVIEVADESIFAVGDEIYINSTVKQTSIISAVDATNSTITATINNAVQSSSSIWVLEDGIYAEYFKTSTKLSGASDTTDLPVWMRPAIAEYAAYLYFISIEDGTRASNWLNTFNTHLKEYWYNLQFQTQQDGIKFRIK